MNTLKKWTRPSNYMGPEYPEYYLVIAQTRDSRVLDQANFIAALKALGGESETVHVIRDSHWACGWLEYILVHESDTKACEIADKIMTAYANYPCIDEELWSRMESEEMTGIWERMGMRERIEFCRANDVSIFAARSEWVPESLEESLRIDL
jgi:hypothetical protein